MNVHYTENSDLMSLIASLITFLLPSIMVGSKTDWPFSDPVILRPVLEQHSFRYVWRHAPLIPILWCQIFRCNFMENYNQTRKSKSLKFMKSLSKRIVSSNEPLLTYLVIPYNLMHCDQFLCIQQFRVKAVFLKHSYCIVGTSFSHCFRSQWWIKNYFAVFLPSSRIDDKSNHLGDLTTTINHHSFGILSL